MAAQAGHGLAIGPTTAVGRNVHYSYNTQTKLRFVDLTVSIFITPKDPFEILHVRPLGQKAIQVNKPTWHEEAVPGTNGGEEEGRGHLSRGVSTVHGSPHQSCKRKYCK